MAEGLTNYYDHAEVDFQWLFKSVNAEIYSPGMCSMSQNVCERYLKHIIDIYIGEQDDPLRYYNIMHSHNLRVLCNFINEKLPEFNFNSRKICMCNDFYFSTRYPGKDSFIANNDDIIMCWESVQYCKQVVDEFLENNR